MRRAAAELSFVLAFCVLVGAARGQVETSAAGAGAAGAGVVDQTSRGRESAGAAADAAFEGLVDQASRGRESAGAGAAADAAFEGLVDRVMALRLAGGLTVAGALAVIPEAELRLREVLAERRQLSEPREPAAGLVEVEAYLPAAEASALVGEIAAWYLPKADPALLAVESASLPATVAGTGLAPSGGAEVALPGADAVPPEGTAPPGWRHCDARELELVRQAASIDLRQRLLTGLAGWRVSASRTLGSLWAARPDFRRACEQQLVGLALPEPILEPTGICRQPLEVSRAAVADLLARAAAACARPIEADLAQAIDPDFQDPLVLDGMAVAPPRGAIRPSVPADAGETRGPEWAVRVLTVTAVGRPPADAPEQSRRLLAAAAAEVEARRRLWLQVEPLPLPDGRTVGDVLAAHPAVARTIDQAILPAAVVTFDADGQATAAFSLRLETVWRLSTE